MALPIRTTVDDIVVVCRYLATKPTGATLSEAKRVLDPKYLDGRKLSALKTWQLVSDEGGRLRLTARGREAIRSGDTGLATALRAVVRSIPPYNAIIERLVHRGESAITATEVAAHWHEHFRADVGESDKTLNDQAVCFFQLVAGTTLGNLVVGRSGAPTRLEFDIDAVRQFVEAEGDAQHPKALSEARVEIPVAQDGGWTFEGSRSLPVPSRSGQAPNSRVFISHGANRQIVAQLKELVQFGKFEPVVSVETETASKPVPEKVLDDMRSCFAAIIHVAAEKVVVDEDGKPYRTLNENVLIEIGAAMALYRRNFILLVEDGVTLPSNLQGLYQCRYEGTKLDMEATMKILKAFNTFTRSTSAGPAPMLPDGYVPGAKDARTTAGSQGNAGGSPRR